MFIKGLVQNGTSVSWEENKSWHTILMIPYARGGAGFSVLDITHPLLSAGKGPLHMYSIFNDAINNKVLVSDYQGEIKEYTYDRGAIHIRKSEEAVRATKMQNDAEDADSDTCDDTDPSTCTNQDAIFARQTNLNAASGKFRIDGTNACFKGTKFTFNLEVPHDATTGIVSQNALMITEEVDGTLKKIKFRSARIDPVSKLLEIEFNSEKVFNASGSDLSAEANNSITIQTSCEGKGHADGKYDYSQ